MMKKSGLILFLFVILSTQLWSQDQLIRDFKDLEAIEKYLKENNYNFKEEDLLIFKDLDNYLLHNNEGLLKSPVIEVFNSEGQHLEQLNNLTAPKKLSNFKKIKNKPKKSAILISEWMSRWSNYKELKDVEFKNNADYYFVLNWSVFQHQSPNNELIFEWYHILKRKQQNGENIKIYLLNMDFQESWNLSEETKTKILEAANKR